MRPLVIIRADASQTIGTGHVMRMLALAQAGARRGLETVFVCAELPERIKKRLEEEGQVVENLQAIPGSMEDWAGLIAIADVKRQTRHRPVWVVTDGYQFDRNYQEAILRAGLRLLVVDDYGHLPEYHCDILLNQNLGADEDHYRKSRIGMLLLGPRYALLRREFLCHLQSTVTKAPKVQADSWNILVLVGGADPNRVACSIIRTLCEVKEYSFAVRVVQGPACHPDPDLKNLSTPTCSIECLHDVRDMPMLMSWADLCVSAAGSTCWELLALSVPTILIICAQNQARLANTLDYQGAAINLGWYHHWDKSRFISLVRLLISDYDLRSRLAAKGRSLVDGFGSVRVVDSLIQSTLNMRRAQERDASLLWTWANDPEVRQASLSNEFIPWNDHIKWFETHINCPDVLILIAEMGNRPIGVARFEADGHGELVISIALSPDSRGNGWGKSVIIRAMHEAVKVFGSRTIIAYIKKNNRRSIKCFESAGFSEGKNVLINGEEVFCLKRAVFFADSSSVK